VLRLLGVAAGAFLVVVLPALGSTNPLRSASALRAENAALEAKSRSALLSLYSLDARLGAAQVRLASLQVELRRLRAQRTTLRHELTIARLGAEISEQQLASRVRQLYEQSELSPLEVVFSASSLSDAMTQLDNMQSVDSLNEDVLAQLQSARTRLLRTGRALALRTRSLVAAVQEAAAAEASLAQTRAARAAYIGGLAANRQLNSTQLARLEYQARAAEARAALLVKAPPAAAVAIPVTITVPVTLSVPGKGAGGRTLTVTITGYALPGRTATGIPVGWGVAAVDPSVIPLGTHIWVPGYGAAVAADVGGSIVGPRIDLWFPSVTQADSWGLRTLTIALN
jgi:3D (Asp-Asp-Asp) domain-containing protein/peptidoglycan hydrolase CwlO-like protein